MDKINFLKNVSSLNLMDAVVNVNIIFDFILIEEITFAYSLADSAHPGSCPTATTT